MDSQKRFMKDKSLKNRIIITVVLLLIIQALAGVPTPGVNVSKFKELIEANNGMGLISMFAGSGLGNLSITMLSITPYITASIILQLMSVVFPKLYEIQRDGEVGMRLFRRYTIALGVVMALLESLGAGFGLRNQGILVNNKWYWVLCVSLIWTVMAFLLMLAGEFIEEKGFGNGISLILLCNILSSYPSDAYTLYQKFIKGNTIGNMVIHGTVILAVIIGLFVFTIYVQETEKRIKIQYSGKLVGNIAPAKSYFPIKLCPGSVVPVIFASSLFSTPILIASFFGADSKYWIFNMLNTSKWFDSNHPSYTIGALIYILLIFGFSYFYTNMVLNPLEIANNFKKSGGIIPGVRPGQPTVEYIERQMKYTIAIGAIALSLIALVPCVLSGVFGLSRLAFAGTSIIITVGVLLETRDKFMAEIDYKVHRKNYSLT